MPARWPISETPLSQLLGAPTASLRLSSENAAAGTKPAASRMAARRSFDGSMKIAFFAGAGAILDTRRRVVKQARQLSIATEAPSFSVPRGLPACYTNAPEDL